MENYLNKNECMSAFPVCITTLFIRPSRDFSRGGEGFSRKKFSREGGGEVSTRGVFWGDILVERVLSVGKFRRKKIFPQGLGEFAGKILSNTFNKKIVIYLWREFSTVVECSAVENSPRVEFSKGEFSKGDFLRGKIFLKLAYFPDHSDVQQLK